MNLSESDSVKNPFCTCTWQGGHGEDCPVWAPQVHNAKRILVCGSRNWKDRNAIENALLGLRIPHAQTVIHGAARGADSVAGIIARRLGYEVRDVPADWSKHGKRAGILRNLEMLDMEPDCVLAFQTDGSRGTQHTIDEARRRRLWVKVIHS